VKNPFLEIPAFPDFPAMTPAAADEALPQLLQTATARVEALERTAEPTWDGYVRALDEAQRPLYEAWGLVSHLQSVCNSEAWRKLEEKYQGDIVAFSLKVGQSARFYALAQELHAALAAAPAAEPAAEAQRQTRLRILAKSIRAAELAGVALPPEKRARFNAVQAELAQLANDFHNHVLDATKAFTLTLADPAEVEGLSADLRAQLAGPNDPAQGPWTATIEDALYVPVMKHARCRAVREKLFRARATRASVGECDNGPLIDRILALRHEMADLLGFPDYAALSLAQKCAPSVAAVEKMIAELDAAAEPVAAREREELAAFARAEGFTETLRPWDTAFWAERLRERRYAYSEEELSKYFNLPLVQKGLFALAERLFGVTVESADWTAPVWHDDVRFFRVRDAQGEVIAHFYFDPYSRPATKSGGAWMNEFRTRARAADGSVTLPLAVICCNQVPPGPDGCAFMRFSEVETLFHEFGHALQHMLTRVEDEDAAGLNLIEWDAVEVASQFMENWCYDLDTVSAFARDARTNAAIPADLLARVRAAKNFRAASAARRQLAFATVDLRLHAQPPADPNALKDAVFARFMPDATVPEDRFLQAFTHIFAGGYAAGYYGYKWSEVMSADLFGAFEEAGLGDEAAVRRLGARYRETILGLGGSRDPMAVFRTFRGRDPEVAALLRQTGLLPEKAK